MQRSELGQTRDPAALVPGDPGSVYRTAATMARFAMPLSAVGDDLRRIDDGGWTGQAAERFHEVFDPQPDRWLTAGAAFTEASEALVGYAHTLEWAQGQAADAIVLWDQAQDATRQAALGMLDQARQQLDDAGEHAARIVAQARDQVPARPRWAGSGDNSDDGFTGSSLGPHQAAWCLAQGAVQCGRAILLQQQALERTNELADKYNWSTGQRNAFRHSYWMGLMTVHGFTYDATTKLGVAHEKDTDTAGELPGSKDSNADIHNNETGARLGVDVRPWYVGLSGFGATEEHEKELEQRLLPMLDPTARKMAGLR